MKQYRIRTYKTVPVAVTLFVSMLLFPSVLYLLHIDKSISVMLFLTFFFLLQFLFDRYFTYYLDVFLSEDAIEGTWHIKAGYTNRKKVLFSDIERWDYVSSNISAAFIIWTKENERLSIRFLNFFATQKSLSELLKDFSNRAKNFNASQSTIQIKERKSFYETKNAKYLAAFAFMCSLVILILMFVKADKIDSFLVLRASLILSTNIALILLVHSKTSSARQQ